MSYRNIDVDGITYRYTVGRTHLKVRGLGVARKEEAGSLHLMQCDCCGEWLTDLGYSLEESQTVRVTPRDVAPFIRGRCAADACRAAA